MVATVRRCDAEHVQVSKRSGLCEVMHHDVSLSTGDLGSLSECGIIRPVAQRGQVNTSTPVRVRRHSIQVCGADVSADFASGVQPRWFNSERARSRVPSRTCDAELRP